MRFLLITQHFFPEASSPSVRLLAISEQLIKKGHSVEIITALPNYPYGKIFEGYRGKFYRFEDMNGISVHRFWIYSALGAGLKRVINYLTFALFAILMIFKIKKPDMIFVESSPLVAGIPGIVFKKIWKIPVVLHIPDLTVELAKSMGFLNDGIFSKMLVALEKKLLKDSTYINYVTEEDGEFLIEERNVPKEKLIFLPNGVDSANYFPKEPDPIIMQELDLAGKTVLLYAGNHGYMHGLETVLDSAKSLENEKIVFIMLGGGSEKDNLVKLAKEMDLKNIIFLDSVPGPVVNDYYSVADIGLSLFRNVDAFKRTISAKIFPCMGSATAIIFAGTGATAKLISKAEAGIVIEPQNHVKLTEAIMQLVNDVKLRKSYGENGRKYLMENLTWEKIVNDWLKQLNIN